MKVESRLTHEKTDNQFFQIFLVFEHDLVE
jgi:hypothetical protein